MKINLKKKKVLDRPLGFSELKILHLLGFNAKKENKDEHTIALECLH